MHRMFRPIFMFIIQNRAGYYVLRVITHEKLLTVSTYRGQLETF
jgi:hypothetical protein